MENQHRKIKGYRELCQEEIDLMNRIKEKGKEILLLQKQLEARLSTDFEHKQAEALRTQAGPNDFSSDEYAEFNRFIAAEPQRWAEIGKTNIELGVMALVRAVAQPA